MIVYLTVALASGAPLAPGDYLLEVEIASETKLPFFGRARVTTTTLAAARIDLGADGLELSQTTCSVSVDGGAPARTVVPAAFVDAFPTQRYPVVLTEDGSGWAFTADPGPICIGCDGGLPASAAEATDWEGDGRPGGTIELRVPIFGRVLVYVAQRSHVVYEGRSANGGASGALRFVDLEQITLGASHPGFSFSPKVEPVPAESRFRLTPLDEPLDCRPLTPDS